MVGVSRVELGMNDDDSLSLLNSAVIVSTMADSLPVVVTGKCLWIGRYTENHNMKYILPLMLAIAIAPVSAADWPRFHGPNNDNVSPDTGLLKTWPEGGPTRIWEAAGIGEGYSTVAIAVGRPYTTGSIDGDCVITALHRAGTTAGPREYATS